MTTTLNPTAGKAAGSPKPVAPFSNIFSRGYEYPLLLAITNDDNAPAAVRMTSALASRGARPGVVEVTEFMLPLAGSPNGMIAFSDELLGEDYRETREKLLRDLITRTSGRNQEWPVRSVSGDPADRILEEARARRAELIVLGIHQHGAMEQAIGENTATRVIRRADVPVLGVRPSLSRVPRRIMVAVDFGTSSTAGAHIAANLADRGGTVVLVHVHSLFPVVDEADEGAALIEREGINAAFEKLSEEISKGRRIKVERVLRTGDAATHLITAAASIAPDLIVIARQRHHLVTRMILGSTSRRLVRTGRWSVLVVPPADAPVPAGDKC